MDLPVSVSSNLDNKSIQNEDHSITSKVIETCMFVSDMKLSEGRRHIAKRKFIMTIVNGGKFSASTQRQYSTPVIPCPQPPPGTKNCFQRERELEAETLINQATPLAAMGALMKRIVMLGIEKDILIVRISDVEAANDLLSSKLEELRATNNTQLFRLRQRDMLIRGRAHSFRTHARRENKLSSDLERATEKARECQKFMDLQCENMNTIKELFKKAQSRHRVEVYELNKTHKSLEAQIDEVTKDHSFLLQQATDLPSTRARLLICQKHLDSQRESNKILRRQCERDRTESSKKIRELVEAKEALTIELDELRKAHKALLQLTAALAQPDDSKETKTKENSMKVNLATVVSYFEYQQLAEAQDIEITQLNPKTQPSTISSKLQQVKGTTTCPPYGTKKKCSVKPKTRYRE